MKRTNILKKQERSNDGSVLKKSTIFFEGFFIYTKALLICCMIIQVKEKKNRSIHIFLYCDHLSNLKSSFPT